MKFLFGLGYVVLILILFYGCAQGPVSAPTTAGVQGSISNAKRYNDVAVTSNAQAQTNVQRIDAKAKVLEKYWK